MSKVADTVARPNRGLFGMDCSRSMVLEPTSGCLMADRIVSTANVAAGWKAALLGDVKDPLGRGPRQKPETQDAIVYFVKRTRRRPPTPGASGSRRSRPWR